MPKPSWRSCGLFSILPLDSRGCALPSSVFFSFSSIGFRCLEKRFQWHCIKYNVSAVCNHNWEWLAKIGVAVNVASPREEFPPVFAAMYVDFRSCKPTPKTALSVKFREASALWWFLVFHKIWPPGNEMYLLKAKRIRFLHYGDLDLCKAQAYLQDQHCIFLCCTIRMRSTIAEQIMHIIFDVH